MRTSRRAPLCSISFLAFSVLTALAIDARAGTTTLTASFQGTITGLEPGVNLPTSVALGQTIKGGLAYDPSQLSGPGSNGIYTFNQTGNLNQSLYFNVLGTGFGDAYGTGSFVITMSESNGKSYMDLHAVTEFQKTETGSSSTVPAYIDLVFSSTTYTGGLALPKLAATLGQFALQTGSFTWDPDGGFTSDDTQINPDSVQGPSETPEPSSLALACIAVGTVTASFLVSRRKAIRSA